MYLYSLPSTAPLVIRGPKGRSTPLGLPHGWPQRSCKYTKSPKPAFGFRRFSQPKLRKYNIFNFLIQQNRPKTPKTAPQLFTPFGAAKRPEWRLQTGGMEPPNGVDGGAKRLVKICKSTHQASGRFDFLRPYTPLYSLVTPHRPFLHRPLFHLASTGNVQVFKDAMMKSQTVNLLHPFRNPKTLHIGSLHQHPPIFYHSINRPSLICHDFVIQKAIFVAHTTKGNKLLTPVSRHL